MKKALVVLLGLLGSKMGALAAVEAQEPRFKCGFYGGGSINFERMSGDRSDGVFTPGAGPGDPDDTFFYVNNDGLSDNTGGFEFFLGYLYRFSNSNIVLGLEPYGGYKWNEDTASGLEPTIGFRETAKIQREWDFGALVRLGCILQEAYLLYTVVGPDWGYFKYKHEESGTPGTNFDNKWIVGIRYGVGLEMQFETFRVGVQLTMTNYNNTTFNAHDSTSSNNFGIIKANIATVGFRVSYPF